MDGVTNSVMPLSQGEMDGCVMSTGINYRAIIADALGLPAEDFGKDLKPRPMLSPLPRPEALDKRLDKQLMLLAQLAQRTREAWQQAKQAEAQANHTKILLYGLLCDLEDAQVTRHDELDNPPRYVYADEHSDAGLGAC